ncbi:MAG: hypothetical protein K8S97_04360 [Anaerolineae bacterium]|nr:hypothetical protein [Anaerolineae bacterium]
MARYYPPTYREEEVTKIVGGLDSGYSIAVVGPPSVGKSNLLKFLDQERDVEGDENPWKVYAPKSMHKGRIIAVPVDPNALLPPLSLERGNVAAKAWPGFELLIHRATITPQLVPRPLNTSLLPPENTLSTETQARITAYRDTFTRAHLEVTDFEDSLHGHLALRHLEAILKATLDAHKMQNSPIRVAFVLDEFERLLDTMPDYFFVALRSIRDLFKYQVMFVIFARSPLTTLVEERGRMAQLEPFVELFHDQTVYLGPFVDEDAWHMIEALEKREVPHNDYALSLLIRATGGFAGLMRAGFKHTAALREISREDKVQAIVLAARQLVAETNVQAECETLVRGLRPPEIEALYGVAHQKTDLDQAVLKELVHKSLLSEGGSGVIRVIPPVLMAYIRNHPSPPKPKPRPRPVTMPE